MILRATFGAALLIAAHGIADARDTYPIGKGFTDDKTIDINGFFLGMSAAQARPLLERHYAAQKRKAAFANARMMNDEFTVFGYGVVDNNNYTYDNFAVAFSAPASGNQAVYIRRWAHYLPADRLDRSATIAALKQKFGEPSEQDATSLSYYFRNGRLMTASEAKKSGCRVAGRSLTPLRTIGQQGDNPRANSIYDSLRNAFAAIENNGGNCDVVIEVSWSFGFDRVGGNLVDNKETLQRFEIVAFDAARFFATNNTDAVAIDEAEKKAIKQLPKGVGAPKL